MEDSTTQSDPTPQTFAYRNGIQAAKGVKWIGRKLRAFDNTCVASVKRKKWPSWTGHIPVFLLISGLLFLASIVSLALIFFGVLAFALLIYQQVAPDWKVGHYEMDGYHYPDGSIDHNDR